MSADIYDLNCPSCGKVYKLPRAKVVKHVGKTIYCRGCSQPFSVPPLPAFEPADVIEAGMFAAESAAGNVPIVDHQPAVTVPESSLLPPPFSAEVLPSINDLLPAVSEPPTIDLPHIDPSSSGDDGDQSEDEDDSVITYRKGSEHGALAVEEAPPDLDSNGSVYESTADLPFPIPEVVPPNVTSPAVTSPAELSDVQPPQTRPRVAQRSIVPQFPSGIDLDSVPIARAAPPPASPVIEVDFKPVKKRLAWLIVMAVIIILLLITNLLATLGYLPHRPL